MARRSYTRDDVQTHSEGFGREGRPAVNVKVYRSVRDAWGEFAKAEEPDARFTLDWIEEHVSDDAQSAIFWHVCEFEFEQIQEDAAEVFGRGVQVWQEGRMGGWAVVEGLPELDEWDAIALGKWRRFERLATGIANDVPYQCLYSLYANEFEAWADEQADDALGNSEAPVDLALAGCTAYLQGHVPL